MLCSHVLKDTPSNYGRLKLIKDKHSQTNQHLSHDSVHYTQNSDFATHSPFPAKPTFTPIYMVCRGTRKIAAERYRADHGFKASLSDDSPTGLVTGAPTCSG